MNKDKGSGFSRFRVVEPENKGFQPGPVPSLVGWLASIITILYNKICEGKVRLNDVELIVCIKTTEPSKIWLRSRIRLRPLDCGRTHPKCRNVPLYYN